MESEVKVVDLDKAVQESDHYIKQHVWGSVALGLLPIPIVDFAGLSAIQLNMIRKIAGAFEVPFMKYKVKTFIGALVGGGVPTALGPVLGSLIKVVPIVGQTAGALTMSAMGGASTYAIGKVFVMHFASGGTFLDFDPEKVKEYYSVLLKEGEKFVASMKSGSGPKVDKPV